MNNKYIAVIEFLFREGENTANVHRKLVTAYGKAVLNVSTVRRWISKLNGNLREKEGTDLRNTPCSSTLAGYCC